MAQARAILLAVLSALVGLGLLPVEVKVVLEEHASPIIAGIFAVWTVFAQLRARKDKKEKAGVA